MCVCVESFTKLRHRDDVLEETDHLYDDESPVPVLVLESSSVTVTSL